MPEERGSIYKSTANEIGEALKAKLGGEGFAPKDWSENLNLLGIASEDTEAAINSLKESEGSGERGSILLSTANAIGSMLNKKYNSSRGFSPAEWASATRKMKALETDTKSGGIVNLKGAKEVPITSLVGTVNPTLEGVDSLTATRLGKNLLDDSKKLFISQNIVIGRTTGDRDDFCLRLKAGTYTFSVTTADGTAPSLYIKNSDTNTMISGFPAYSKFLKTFTLDEDTNLAVFVYKEGYTSVDDISTAQIEVGSENTAYTPYVEPTTYTANLGRTIYGGSADVVKGEGVSEYGLITFDGSSDENWQEYSSYNGFYIAIPTMKVGTRQDGVTNYLTNSSTSSHTTDTYWLGVNSNRLFLIEVSQTMGATIEALRTYLSNNPLILVYPLATSEDFTFDPIQINTSGDTENFYTSNGDTSITYYEEPTPYTRGSASGMIASIPEANTEFPFTKLKATIAPSVEGVSSVVVKNEGKNLFSFEKDQTITRLKTFNLRLFAGSYTFSWDFISTTAETLPVYMQVSFLCEDGTTVYNPVDVIQGRMTRSFTLAKNVTSINIYANTNYTTSDGITTVIENIQLEVGSSATEYSAYKNPTTYTAELGETVFGGSVDLVSGEVVDSNDNTFYIEPQEIYPNEGVNNIWNDANGITEVGYFGE